MKGYFGQLARHTGLRFADSRASRTRAIAPAAPLHVEEVAMVSPMMPSVEAPARDEPVANTTVVEKVETVQQPKAEEASIREIQVAPISEERPREKTESIVQSVPIEQPATLTADNTDIKHDHSAARIERIEVPVSAQSVSEQKVEPEAPHEVSEIEVTDPIEREVLVREYLREVRAWVAASPMPDEEVSESQSLTDPQPESVAFTVGRESIPIAQPEPRSEVEVDVHDMSLSIGNISIVIEEPSPAAAAVIAPIPSAPPPQPQTRHEPTSLSRYYLRSW